MFDDNFLNLCVLFYCDVKDLLSFKRVSRLYHELCCECLIQHHSLIANNKKFWKNIDAPRATSLHEECSFKVFINDSLMCLHRHGSKWWLHNIVLNEYVEINVVILTFSQM